MLGLCGRCGRRLSERAVGLLLLACGAGLAGSVLYARDDVMTGGGLSQITETAQKEIQTANKQCMLLNKQLLY
jgi:hypothetical protein